MASRCSWTILVVALSCGAAFAQTPPAGAPQNQPQMPMGGMGSQPESNVTTAQVAGPLTVSFGDKSAEWTPAKLAALPQTTVTVYNEHTKATETYAGVPLIELLTPLGVAEKPRGKQLRLYVMAQGSDGYEVVYSIGEVTPDVSKATVMVADSEDGKPIATDGPLKMIATDEKRPARWVRNLAAIRVMTAQ